MKITISNKLWTVLICLILTFAIFAVYWQVRNHDFVNFDDNYYIYNNPYIQNGLTPQSIAYAFNFVKEVDQTGVWHPLTSLSHIFDMEFFGLNPGRHHLMNVVFHIINTLLLFLVFRYMTGNLWPSAFIAAVFALHPQHVESVAWASERKDVLSTMFLMLTIFAYAYYTRRPSIPRYILIIAACVLGLMSKPMLVTLPFILLLLDYWPLQRFSFELKKIYRLVGEKIPLFVLSGIVCIISFSAQKIGGAVAATGDLPLKFRVFNAAIAYAEYLEKFFYPVNLSAYYSIGADNFILYQFLVCLAVLIVLSAAVIFLHRRRYLAVGWFWFLGTLVPVIGLVQVGSQRMADRYSYIPQIGLAVMLAWGISELFRNTKYRKVFLPAASVILLSILTIMSYRQTATWRNSVTLFERAIKVVPNNWYAHKLLAFTLQNQKQYDRAIQHYQEVLKTMPSLDIQHNIGDILLLQGKYDDVIALYQQILPEIPENAEPVDISPPKYSKEYEILRIYTEGHVNLGIALEHKGNIEQAVKHYREALRVRSDFTRARDLLENALANHKSLPDTLENR